MKNTPQQINKNLLAALKGLVSDWERVHVKISEEHEVKAAIREAELADSTETKYYIHSVYGVFSDCSRGQYVMTKHPDGWYAVMENGGETFVDKPEHYGFNRAVEDGRWVETTLEKAFGAKNS